MPPQVKNKPWHPWVYTWFWHHREQLGQFVFLAFRNSTPTHKSSSFNDIFLWNLSVHWNTEYSWYLGCKYPHSECLGPYCQWQHHTRTVSFFKFENTLVVNRVSRRTVIKFPSKISWDHPLKLNKSLKWLPDRPLTICGVYPPLLYNRIV